MIRTRLIWPALMLATGYTAPAVAQPWIEVTVPIACGWQAPHPAPGVACPYLVWGRRFHVHNVWDWELMTVNSSEGPIPTPPSWEEQIADTGGEFATIYSRVESYWNPQDPWFVQYPQAIGTMCDFTGWLDTLLIVPDYWTGLEWIGGSWSISMSEPFPVEDVEHWQIDEPPMSPPGQIVDGVVSFSIDAPVIAHGQWGPMNLGELSQYSRADVTITTEGNCNSTIRIYIGPEFSAGDWNRDGDNTPADVFAFLSDWFAGSERAAACDGDAAVCCTADIFAFLTAWFGGR